MYSYLEKEWFKSCCKLLILKYAVGRSLIPANNTLICSSHLSIDGG